MNKPQAIEALLRCFYKMDRGAYYDEEAAQAREALIALIAPEPEPAPDYVALASYLSNECGSLCMDDDDDRTRLALMLVAKAQNHPTVT